MMENDSVWSCDSFELGWRQNIQDQHLELKVHVFVASATTFSESVWYTNYFRTKEKKNAKEVAFFLPRRSCILLAQKEFDLFIYFEFFWVLESFFVELSWLSREPGDVFSYHKYSLTNCQWPTWINFWGSGKIKFTTPTFISWSEMAEWEAVWVLFIAFSAVSLFLNVLCWPFRAESELELIIKRSMTHFRPAEANASLWSSSLSFSWSLCFLFFLSINGKLNDECPLTGKNVSQEKPSSKNGRREWPGELWSFV